MHKRWKSNKNDLNLHKIFINLKKEVNIKLKEVHPDYWLKFGDNLKRAYDLLYTTFYILLKSSMGLNLKSYKMGKCSFNCAIFDKEGNEIHDVVKIRERWKEYFEELLNMEDMVVDNIDEFLQNNQQLYITCLINHFLKMKYLLLLHIVDIIKLLVPMVYILNVVE